MQRVLACIATSQVILNRQVTQIFKTLPNTLVLGTSTHDSRRFLRLPSGGTFASTNLS